jgi:hypothetical protein
VTARQSCGGAAWIRYSSTGSQISHPEGLLLLRAFAFGICFQYVAFGAIAQSRPHDVNIVLLRKEEYVDARKNVMYALCV